MAETILWYDVFGFNPPARQKPESSPNFKNISLGFANPCPQKMLRKTESAFMVQEEFLIK